MSWNIVINNTSEIDQYKITLESNGLKFIVKIISDDIERFIKRGQLLLKK